MWLHAAPATRRMVGNRRLLQIQMNPNLETPLHHHLFLHGYAHKGTTIGSDQPWEDPKGAPAPQGDTCGAEEVLLPAMWIDRSQVASGVLTGVSRFNYEKVPGNTGKHFDGPI